MNKLLLIIFACLTFVEIVINVRITKFKSIAWKKFKILHSLKFYDLEDVKRQRIFEENMKYIKKHNSLNTEIKLAMNHFGHLTNEEFKYIHLTREIKVDIKNFIEKKVTKNINTTDWRDKGIVNPIKDQKRCGSCWAFSAISSLESAYALKYKKLMSFSEQDLVDCSMDYGNYGCFGGLMDNAFTYIKTNGITLENDYNYTSKQNSICKHDQYKVITYLSEVVKIKPGSEEDLTNAISTVGPISIAIDASGRNFQFYKSGVYFEKSCNSNKLNHGVTAIGVADNYYIVRNSWGEKWGNKGYIKMSRNRDNNCGIASIASYPVM